MALLRQTTRGLFLRCAPRLHTQTARMKTRLRLAKIEMKQATDSRQQLAVGPIAGVAWTATSR